MTTFNVDTFGQTITFDTDIDLTGYTALAIVVRKPTGEEQILTTGVAVSGDDVDGVLTYTVTSAAELWDIDGPFKLTPRVTFSAGRHESATPAYVTINRVNQA